MPTTQSPTSPQEFEARLELMGPGGAWTCLRIPFGVEEVFGSKARVSVMGTINCFAFRSSVFPTSDGTHFMMVNKSMQQGASVKPGDVVRVALQRDTAPRTLSVPKDLEDALGKHRDARGRFEVMSYSHKKEYLDWIESAKRQETRLRRIEKAVTMLASGKRLKS